MTTVRTGATCSESGCAPRPDRCTWTSNWRSDEVRGARSQGVEVAMNEWLREQIANGFSSFKGAALSGSIPVKEELINELIAHYLATADETRATPAFDARELLRFIAKATIHADTGVVTLQ